MNDRLQTKAGLRRLKLIRSLKRAEERLLRRKEEWQKSQQKEPADKKAENQ